MSAETEPVTSEDVVEEDAGADETEVAEATEEEEEMDWFVLHTFAGQEEKTRERLLDRVEEEGKSDVIDRVIVPTQEVMEIRQGEKQEVEKQLYPGYMFIKMKMTEDNWHFVRQTRGITGFVGTQLEPIPVRQTEMGDVLQQIEMGGVEPQVKFEPGATVRIIAGAMEEMTGTVKDVDIERAKIKVSVDMFGRSTPVELNFDQAEKL